MHWLDAEFEAKHLLFKKRGCREPFNRSAIRGFRLEEPTVSCVDQHQRALVGRERLRRPLQRRRRHPVVPHFSPGIARREPNKPRCHNAIRRKFFGLNAEIVLIDRNRRLVRDNGQLGGAQRSQVSRSAGLQNEMK